MFSKTSNKEVDGKANEINQDVGKLADALEDVLKSFGSDAKDEAENARQKAQSLLKETRARLRGNYRIKQVARNTVEQADDYIRENPWQGVGMGAAIGIFLGALICSRG